MSQLFRIYAPLIVIIFVFNSGCTTKSSESLFTKNCQLAIEHENGNMYQQAKDYYLKALDALPPGERYNEKRAYALSCLAKLEDKALKQEKALQYTTRAIALYKPMVDRVKAGHSMRDKAFQLVELLTLKAKLELKRKDLDEAIDTINSADLTGKKFLAPDHLRYRIMITKAQILTARGDYEAASELKKAATVISPSKKFSDQ